MQAEHLTEDVRLDMKLARIMLLDLLNQRLHKSRTFDSVQGQRCQIIKIKSLAEHIEITNIISHTGLGANGK